MKNHYENMTRHDFVRCLHMVLTDKSANDVLWIPGVYDVLSRHYYHEVLEQWRTEQEMAEEEGE